MTVLVAEDDALHRRFVCQLLSREFPAFGEVVEASDGKVALKLALEHRPDYVVLDLQIPQLNGVETARAIWQRRPDTRILFWSNYADEPYVRGVSRIVPPQAVYGYILKSATEERLSFAIQGVFREEQCVIDREVRGVQRRTEDRLEGLTDLEYEILHDIAVGLTDKAIALRRKVSTRGVQSRLQSLYDKLRVNEDQLSGERDSATFNTRTRVICLALMRGLLNRDDIRREVAAVRAWIDRVKGP